MRTYPRVLTGGVRKAPLNETAASVIEGLAGIPTYL